MLNLAIQLSMLASGLLVNFITPAVFGVAAYGQFIAANALVFLIHKTVDIISEPLITFTAHAHLIFVSLTLNLVVVVLFCVVDEYVGIGSSTLLLSMLLSSSVILSLHALVRKRAVLVFQIAVVALFVLLLSQSRRFGLTIEQVMEISTLLPASFAVAYILVSGAGLPTREEFTGALMGMVRAMPRLLSVTAVYNLLTNALPLILSFLLGARELGIFKIASSVVQSANAMFPINTRAILTAMVKGGDAQLWPALSRVALFYFSGAGMAFLLVGLLFPELAHYMALAALFPALYWTMLAERYALAQQRSRAVARINLLIGSGVVVAATLTTEVAFAMVLYAVGFALYGLRLAALEGNRRIMPVLALAPLAVYFGPFAGLGYLALVALLQLVWNRLNFQDIRLVSRSI